jgi:S-adenosylmethionine:tRNA ribosyltransferase-isomerase
LSAGDVVVVNSSATEPAALGGRLDGAPVGVHIAGPAPTGESWVVELRELDRSGPMLGARQGDRVDIDGAGTLKLDVPAGTVEGGVRLWNTTWTGRRGLIDVVRTVGAPIRYAYVPEAWPIASYRTIFEHPRAGFSSAEMASAARPFTNRVVEDLRRRGVEIVSITLHTGVSSPDHLERPMPERFEVGQPAAAAINRARARGNRIVAVGTTSTRAVESAVDGSGVAPRRGWTDLVLSKRRPAAVIDGLLTGWHPPEASHVDLLEAVAGPRVVSETYERAHELGYRSHEFGDSCLLFRGRTTR